jgi:hypothetical protein
MPDDAGLPFHSLTGPCLIPERLLFLPWHRSSVWSAVKAPPEIYFAICKLDGRTLTVLATQGEGLNGRTDTHPIKGCVRPESRPSSLFFSPLGSFFHLLFRAFIACLKNPPWAFLRFFVPGRPCQIWDQPCEPKIEEIKMNYLMNRPPVHSSFRQSQSAPSQASRFTVPSSRTAFIALENACRWPSALLPP